jgi:hypothetical protein
MDKRLKIVKERTSIFLSKDFRDDIIEAKKKHVCRSITHFIEDSIKEKIERLKVEGIITRKIRP